MGNNGDTLIVTMTTKTKIIIGILVLFCIIGIFGYRKGVTMWNDSTKRFREAIDSQYKEDMAKQAKEIDALTKENAKLRVTYSKLKSERDMLMGKIDSLMFVMENTKPPVDANEARNILRELGYEVVR